jgi:3-dehydroquinate synthase
LYLSQKLLGFPEQDAREISSFIRMLFQGITIDAHPDELLATLQADKKNDQGKVNFVLLKGIGDPVINQNPGVEMIKEAIDFALHHINSPVEHHG